jgi:Amt family ammonium transporter
MKKTRLLSLLCAAAIAMLPTFALADDAAAVSETDAVVAAEEVAPAPTVEDAMAATETLLNQTNLLWTCLAAFLVFFMQAGFACVECGFTRAKNACNIMMKNMFDFAIGSIAFWVVGFGLMFGATSGFGLFGTNGFLFDPDAEGAIKSGSSGWGFLIFQTVFAATAATIVSGAMAERTKFSAYLIYSAAITLIVYPIFGCWAWNYLMGAGGNGGWLYARGFLDFAGSTVVHSVGGWAALAGAIVLGPRKGKYKDGKPQPIPGHNIPLAALGVFILWLGWFGFNPGSTTSVSAGDSIFAKIAVTTNMAGCAGAMTALITAWVLFKKPDVSFALNGALAGLVSITAGCDVMNVPMALLTGAIGGVLVVFACLFFERIGVDDPVGAVSVHGVCGAWGTLAIGLIGPSHGLLTGNGAAQLITQATGVGAAFAWSFPVSLAIFLAIKYSIGLRASEQDELEGLDITEHGMQAYPMPSAIGYGMDHVPGAGHPSPSLAPIAKPTVAPTVS